MTPEDIRKQYDYLDKLHISGWLWELIRRNEKYKALIRELSVQIKDTPLNAERFLTLGTWELKLDTLNARTREILTILQNEFGIKPNASVARSCKCSRHYLLADVRFPEDDRAMLIGFPNPETSYNEFCHPPVIHGAKPVAAAKISSKALDALEKGDDNLFNQYCFKMINKISPSLDIENTLYVGISMNAKKEDLKAQLERLIDEHVKTPKRAKFYPDKWKYGLIVRDIRNDRSVRRTSTFSEICERLSYTYPNNKNLIVEKNIQNYYRTVETLISSGFKTHMYL
jgi:hypothetical protein